MIDIDEVQRELRLLGYALRIKHYRLAYDPNDGPDWADYHRPHEARINRFIILPCGGETAACIRRIDTDETVAVGFSHCHPKDNFSYAIGRDIAIGRALKDLSALFTPFTRQPQTVTGEAHIVIPLAKLGVAGFATDTVWAKPPFQQPPGGVIEP